MLKKNLTGAQQFQKKKVFRKKIFIPDVINFTGRPRDWWSMIVVTASRRLSDLWSRLFILLYARPLKTISRARPDLRMTQHTSWNFFFQKSRRVLKGCVYFSQPGIITRGGYKSVRGGARLHGSGRFGGGKWKLGINDRKWGGRDKCLLFFRALQTARGFFRGEIRERRLCFHAQAVCNVTDLLLISSQ